MAEVLPSETETVSVLRARLERLQQEYSQLAQQKKDLELHVLKSEARRRALMHLLSDLNTLNKKLADQRKAMIHILADYEHDRSHLAKQTEGLDNSRRALMHILQDAHQSNLRLENGRKAMIHIMTDLKETTEEVRHREQELREKQEQLVQAAKLATLGELTAGVAHELNNPLNNIGLFVGNAIDFIALGVADINSEVVQQELRSAMQQVRKATEIISHLRTFGRAAPVSHEPINIEQVVRSAISLMQEQLRLRQIAVHLHFPPEEVIVIGNAIRLEQVFINLLTNARDALADAARKEIRITCTVNADMVNISFYDSGQGIPMELKQRVFDPFFTTKEVGAGMGLGLSITYGIIKDLQGTISIEDNGDEGTRFFIQLPHHRDIEA
jgi:C4-dicarboxylate-specific signal transduction histidine kinase